MTKEELTILWDGLPGDTQIMFDDSDIDSAHWTFRDADAEVECLIQCEYVAPAIGEGHTSWERPAVRGELQNTKVISNGPVPVIVLK